MLQELCWQDFLRHRPGTAPKSIREARLSFCPTWQWQRQSAESDMGSNPQTEQAASKIHPFCRGARSCAGSACGHRSWGQRPGGHGSRDVRCYVTNARTHTCSDARRVATAPRWCRAAATPELELTRTKLSPGAVARLQPAHRDGPEALPVPATRQVLAATKLSDFAGWVPDSTQHQPALPAVPGVAMRAGVLGFFQGLRPGRGPHSATKPPRHGGPACACTCCGQHSGGPPAGVEAAQRKRSTSVVK